ncbi:MAG: hypothetical protein IJ466_02210 [Clostridia bacterium]|nr:hypothetical protein [Clostridia bacterium]
MGLFSKEYCCLCGKQAKLLRREKLGDGEYICSDCRAECSDDANFKRMDSESVKAHIEENTEDQRIIAEDFNETDAVHLGRRTILAVDGESGCFYSPTRERPDLITFDKVYDYRLRISTHRPPPPDHDGPGGPGLLDSIIDLVDIFTGSGDHRLPFPMRGEEIDSMYFVIDLAGHDFIDGLEIDLLPGFHDHNDEREAYYAARQMIELFDHYHDEYAFAGEEADEE